MSAMNTDKYESSDVQGFYSWNESLKAVYYGPGSLKTALPKLLKTIGGKKALVVTGKSLHTKVSLINVHITSTGSDRHLENRPT